MITSMVKRDFGYVFWTFAEQAASMGLSRLALFPIAAFIIGKESFGIFATALSISLIIGEQPGNGLMTGLLRSLAVYPDGKDQLRFCGTALKLCHRTMITIVAIGVICLLLIAFTTSISIILVHCTLPLIIGLYFDNLFYLILTESRYHRQFKSRSLWFIFRSVLSVLLGIIGALLAMEIGLAWGFTAGNIISYIFLRSRRQEWAKAPYDSEMAQLLKSVWLHMTVAGIIALLGPYLNRIALSFFSGYESVSELVAATSVMFIFTIPLTCFSGLLLSILSKYETIDKLSKRGWSLWLIMLFTGTLILPFLFYYMGPFILNILYPDFSSDSLPILKIVFWMLPFQSLILLMRPFVVKFCTIKVIPAINSINMASILIPALILIPLYSAKGAAWAIVTGCIITGLSWACTALVYFKKSNIISVFK